MQTQIMDMDETYFRPEQRQPPEQSQWEQSHRPMLAAMFRHSCEDAFSSNSKIARDAIYWLTDIKKGDVFSCAFACRQLGLSCDAIMTFAKKVTRINRRYKLQTRMKLKRRMLPYVCRGNIKNSSARGIQPI